MATSKSCCVFLLLSVLIANANLFGQNPKGSPHPFPIPFDTATKPSYHNPYENSGNIKIGQNQKDIIGIQSTNTFLCTSLIAQSDLQFGVSGQGKGVCYTTLHFEPTNSFGGNGFSLSRTNTVQSQYSVGMVLSNLGNAGSGILHLGNGSNNTMVALSGNNGDLKIGGSGSNLFVRFAGANNANAMYKFQYQDDAYLYCNRFFVNSVQVSSDSNLKYDIKPLGDVLFKLAQIQAYAYKYKLPELSLNGNGGKPALSLALTDSSRHVGVLAQEVLLQFPDLVVRNSQTGYLSVNYNGLVPILLKGTQELSAKVNTLEKENAELKWALQGVLVRIQALESKSGLGIPPAVVSK